MNQRFLRVLYEIRLRWSEDVHEDASGRDGGFWLPHTPHNQGTLDDAVARGNSLYGERTHWIEKRQA